MEGTGASPPAEFSFQALPDKVSARRPPLRRETPSQPPVWSNPSHRDARFGSRVVLTFFHFLG